MATPLPALVSGLDTHYQTVKARIQQVNPDRAVAGLLDAQDWPPEVVQPDAFYCLVLGAVPAPSDAGSISIPIMIYTIQWLWLNQGTDLAQGEQARSRGNRYRVNAQMESEILYGLFPYFAAKCQYGVNPADGSLTSVPISPQDTVFWQRPTFLKRLDEKSGVIYGTATTQLVNMTDEVDQ